MTFLQQLEPEKRRKVREELLNLRELKKRERALFENSLMAYINQNLKDIDDALHSRKHIEVVQKNLVDFSKWLQKFLARNSERMLVMEGEGR